MLKLWKKDLLLHKARKGLLTLRIINSLSVYWQTWQDKHTAGRQLSVFRAGFSIPPFMAISGTGPPPDSSEQEHFPCTTFICASRN